MHRSCAADSAGVRAAASLECIWKVAREGAGLVRFRGGSALLEGHIDWVAASIFDPNVAEPALPDPLPLFPDLDRRAAWLL